MADGSVIIDIKGDESDFKKSLDNVKSDAKRSENSIDGLGKAGQKAGSDIKQGMKEAASGLNETDKSAKDSRESLKDLDKGAEDSADSIKGLASAIVSGLKDCDGSISSLTSNLLNAVSQWNGGLDGAASKVGSFAGAIKAVLKIAAVKKAVEVTTEAFKQMIDKAAELKSSLNDLQASTGASAEEMEKYKSVLESVYSNNFGESMEDVANAISDVRKNLGDLDASSMEQLTKGALALRDTFDYDVSESTRAAKALMDNFGTSGEEAFNLITTGAQNGLDYSGELIDSISEYSVQFGKLGLSADDMFKIFQAGADSGAWNLDKVGDAVKEFSIRAIDGSNTTAEGFKALGMSADDMAKKFAAGGDTARDAFQQTIQAIADMDDPVQQSIVGVDLFGTMWEDLGPEVVTQLADITDEAYASSDALQNMMDVKYDDFNSAAEAVKRSVDVLIGNIGTGIESQLTSVAGSLANGIQAITAGLEEDGFNGAVTAAQNVLRGFAGGISNNLPQMVSSGVEAVAKFISGALSIVPQLISIGASVIAGLIKGLAQALPKLPGIAATAIENFCAGIESGDSHLLASGAKLLLSVISGILKTIPELVKAAYRIYLAIAEALIQKAGDLINRGAEIVKQIIQGIAKQIPGVLAKGREIVRNIANGILGGISSVKSSAARIGSSIVSTLKSIASKAKEVGRNIIEGLWNGINSKITWVKNKVQSAVNGIKSVFTGVKGFFTGSPSRWAKKVGGWVIQGLANGFKAEKDTAETAASKVVQNIKSTVSKGMSTAVTASVKLIKKLADETAKAGKETAKDYKAIGETQAENIVKGLESKKDAALDSFEKLVDQQFKVYKNKSGNLEGEYKTAAELLTDTYKDTLDEGYKEAKQLVEDRMSEIATEYQNQYDAIIKKREDLQSKLSGGFSDLFEFDDNGVKLEDLDKSITSIEQYNDTLNKLRDEYGATDEFISQITSLGADNGLKAAQKLLNLGQEGFGAYQEKWLEKQRLAKEVASAFYADQLQTLDEEFDQKMDDALADIPDSLEDIGKQSMQGWIDGMNSKLPDLEKKARSIANRVITAMRNELDIHSPSKKTAALVGAPAAQGVGKGFEETFPATMQKLKNIVDVEMTRTSSRLNTAASGGANSSTREVVNNTTTVDRILRIEVTGSDGEFVRWLRSKLKTEDDRVGPALI